MFRVPATDERITVIGRTGSGKTQGAAFILSKSPFDQIPYVVFDFKREGLFQEIGARQLDLMQPDKAFASLNQAGIFIVRPTPDQTEEVEALLWTIWEHEYCGVFIDEGYMIGKSRAYEALMTQGRSKNIPVITLTQRPSWISRFAFSEADYFMIFQLNDKRDRDTVQSFVGVNIEKKLPRYWSYWYDVSHDQVIRLRPVPPRDQILGEIRSKLAALEQRQVTRKAI